MIAEPGDAAPYEKPIDLSRVTNEETGGPEPGTEP
jgi:hypothetical protein